MPGIGKTFTRFCLGIAVVAVVAACGEKKPDSDKLVVDTAAVDEPAQSAMINLPADSLVHDNSINAAGREISLETNLWYNLMPSPDEESAPMLNVQVRLMTEEKTTVPADWVVDYVWVTMGGGTWGIAPEEEQIGSGAVKERMFRGGPIYDAEDGARTKELPTATVTARISDKDGRQHFLRKSDQAIDRVY